MLGTGSSWTCCRAHSTNRLGGRERGRCLANQPNKSRCQKGNREEKLEQGLLRHNGKEGAESLPYSSEFPNLKDGESAEPETQPAQLS